MSDDNISDPNEDMASSDIPPHTTALCEELPSVLQQLYSTSLELSHIIGDHGMQGILNQINSIIQSNEETLNYMPPTTFPRFARFPPELIAVDDEAGGYFKGMHVRCPLLLVNWEARSEALKIKQDLNGTRLDNRGLKAHLRPAIYANLETDVIWLRSHPRMQYYHYCDWKRFASKLYDDGGLKKFGRVRRLALDFALYRKLFWADWPHFALVDVYNLNLEEIILVVSQQTLRESESVEIVPPVTPNWDLSLKSSWFWTWTSLAETEYLALQDLKRGNQEAYEEELYGGVPQWNLDTRGLYDMSHWTVPRVSLMEVRRVER
ncbi:hypothetical protein NA56DRAFT_745612 [Hyaloscypha hepaticicola]|uniref:Uncharacterized protein n=1 Tax=Hyaloscypha hepaticicola TaxID=2082293 RepID=A0A2J6QFG3_9HELO|nr:hypothetical protein NA56DRAFT_745612 [Hyaloscypha hepaticicola]